MPNARRLAARVSDVVDTRFGRPRPSFRYKINEARRLDETTAASLGRHRHTLWSFDSKTGVRELADRVGVPTPTRFDGPAQPSKVAWENLPEFFVVKPVLGSGGEGVLVVRREAGEFLNLRSGESITADVLRSIGEDVLVEAAVLSGDRLPQDWKIYAFQGRVGLVLQIDRASGVRHCYYDDSFRPLGRVRHGVSIGELAPPRHPDLLLDAAARLSAAVAVPFVRVDMYEDEGGVYLGEMTPRAGGNQRFVPWLDRQLGELWERAEVDLRISRGSFTMNS